MASKCVIIFALFVSICVIRVNSHPIPNSGSSLAEAKTSTSWNLLLALAFTISCAILVFGCLSCCKQRAGFKEFRNPESNANSVGLDFVNPLQEVINQQPSRYSIFSSFVSSASTSSKQPESVVTFEPLPRVLPNKSNPRLPQFNVYTDGVGVSQDWLDDKDFPRDQLHYLRECGQGWFGKVVEGEARGIVANSNKIHRVFVRILKEDASPSEQAFFLREAKPYRDLNHANVLRLLGRCLENVPFLLVFEACSNGDLKSYLKQNIGNRDALVYQGVILRMAIDIASGLSYMLQHTFVHTDIAARNCLVGADLKVKVGDYGISLQNYKEEYYFNGDIALPIRWCAPETLKCTETTIEPQQVTGASCIWSYGVLLWELEEWAELPYKELSNDEVISRVFGSEGLRLPCPSMRTPFTKEIYEIMKECWKDYVDRPSFIHVINALSALLHRFKNKDFDSRWHLSKPNSIPVTDNDDDKSNRRRLALASKSDNDSGIDLDNPKLSKGLSLQQLQQSSSGSPRHRVMNDEYSSGDSPASSRRYSNSSTADLFSSPVSMKHHRSPSLENLHGSLDNICSARRGDDVFEYAGGSGSGSGGEFSWYPREAYQQRRDSDSSSTVRSGKEQKLNFRLGLVSNTDSDVLWNNHQLFQPDSLVEDNSLTRRIDSLGTDTEDEMWRRRIERGEFTEKVKEKSKSVADLMILTHIDCSESSESDSLPSFHSRQSSFKSTRRGSKSNVVATASSLMNSLSFGSESNLPVVEKDQQFQETLKKIQIAKISGAAGGDLEDSLSYMSLQTSANLPSVASKDSAGGSKGGHFLANEASKKRSSQISSQISRENVAEASDSGADNKLPVVCAAETSDEGAAAADQKSKSDESNFLVDEARSCARTTEDRVADVNANDSSENANDDEDLSPVNDPTTASISYDVLYSSSSSSSSSSSESCASNDDSDASSSANDLDSVVIGPSESHTLEFFKGLKTTLVDAANAKPSAQEVQTEDGKKPSEDVQYEESPRTLNDFLNECDDYFYKCDEDIRRGPETRFRTQYCDNCYAKCHFSNNDCLRCCKDRCLDDNCSCESYDNLEKFRSGDCATLNSCPFQSDDSGRGTDQINSGDGSSDKSLEGSISVQMNEVKNRLEDVIAKFVADDSDDNCSSLEEDKEATQVVNEIIEIEELPDDRTVDNELECSVKIEEPMEDENGAISRRGSSFATSEEYEVSLSVDEDTCVKLQSQVSEDSGNCPSVLDSKSATASDSPTTDSGNFVKVEQLFFSVDPKLEKEMEQLKSSTENNIDLENSDLQQRRSFSPDEIEENVDDEQHPKEAYEISDILEGLCEPISLPYSINEEDDGEGDEDSSESSWLPSPIDDDYRRRLDMDEKFVELIRNELLEKLPNTSSTLAIVEPQEEASSDENPRITIEYNTYPSQLSPIPEEEEEEEEYSSLSSIRSMCSSDEDVDVDGGGDGSDSDDCSTSKKYFLPEDDVLIVNTLTNEASIVDKSDSKSVTLASFLKPKLNETYEIEENEDDTIEIADNLDSDSVPTPDSLSPGTSSKTGAHLSYSSSESGNLSDVFLSPSSSKNFDEFDEKSSPCDTRHLNTPENTLLYPSSSNKNDYQKAITNIDELLKNSREFRDNSAAATAAINEFIDPVQCVRDDSWIKSFFSPYHDTCSLVEFNSMSDISESECKSLPADFKSENWPPMDELCDSNDRTPTNEQEKPIAVEPYDSADTTTDADQIDSTDPKSQTHRENDEAGILSSNNFDSTRTKVKNSLALFGNTSKQIRNFHVSLVKDDNYAFVSKTSPTSPKNIVDSYVANSNQSSEKTWKPPLNAFLNSQNLENFGLKEINVNDLMSTSFIECGSQDGSIDQDDIKSDTESEDGEEQCTNDEFEWKKSNEDDNANEEKFYHDSEDENGNDVDDNDDDDDDEDDEELADFVPYSWNIGAVPQKSALKNEEKIKGVKKNVSFKKQKYHCVYEYPKDETNYVRTYDEILQDRMLGLWSLDRDNLYADYSSFSDWELDNCEESQTCSDDLMPYPGLPTTVTSNGNSVSTKLGFYTIGAYDLDTSIKLTSAIEDNPSTYYLSSPGSSSVPSPTTTTSSSSSIPLNNDTRNEETIISEKCNPFKELNLNAKGIENGSKVSDDYVDLPSPGLGELKHTKNRLKLDLSGNASARNEDKRNTTITNAKEEPDENVNDEDAENNTFNYGLNFKSCDISPVVELPKSLTSASVA